MKKTLDILMLEDDADYKFLIDSHLRSRGLNANITLVSTGDDFRREIEKKEYDVVLSDNQLPGYSGSAALKLFREKRADAPFILLTGTLSEDEAMAIVNRGATDYLLKENMSRLPILIQKSIAEYELKRSLKRSNSILRENEEKFRILVDNTPDHIIMQNKDLQYTLIVNPQLGLKKSDMLGRTDLEIAQKGLMTLVDAQALTQIKTKVMTTGVPHNLEVPVKNLRGEEEFFEGSYVPRIDAFGNAVGIMGYFRNITDKKKTEMELKLNESRLESLLRISQYHPKDVQDFLDFALHEAIALTSSKIGYIYFYDEGKKLFQLNSWSRGVMPSCSIQNPNREYELEKTGVWGEAVRQRKPIMVNDFDAPNELKKGYPKGHVSLSRFLTTPIFRDNKIVAVIGVANKETNYTPSDETQLGVFMDSVWNITEKEKTNELLQNQYARFRKVSSEIPGLIYEFVRRNDGTYHVPFATFKIKEIFGCLPQDVSEDFTAIKRVIHPDDISRVIASIEDSARNLTHWQCEYRVQVPGEPLKWLYGNSAPEKLKDGCIKWSGFITDITLHKKEEEELLHTQRLEGIGSIAAGIAHDFNNVLAVTGMQAALLKHQVPESVHKYLDSIIVASQRGADIVKQITTLARKDDVVYTPFNLRHALNDSVTYVEEATKPFESRGIHYKLISEVEKTDTILADSAQIMQIVQNLLNNAIQAMPTGGTLRVQSRNISLLDEKVIQNGLKSSESKVVPAGDYVTFSVADTGCGISPDVYNRIFEPFYTTKPKGLGTGLGLASVSKILDRHHGYIDVQTQVGKGTQFEIYLPALKEKERDSVIPVEVSANPFGGKILVVDDNYAFLEAVKESLQLKGYVVETAATYDEAIAHFSKHPDISLLLTDLNLPGQSGLELIKSGVVKNIPVVGMTGHIDESVRSSWPKEYKLLAKPISLPDLLATVHENIAVQPVA